MEQANLDIRENYIEYGNFIQVNYALVEEVYTPNSRTGYLLISYDLPGEKEMTFQELVQLNVDWNTILINQYGDSISLCSIIKGDRVNATFSKLMTRSIPPQSNAYRIIALMGSPSFRVTTGRILMIDSARNVLYTENPYNSSDQMRFTISSATNIVNYNGNQMQLTQLKPGEMVRVEHANFQTASIPPQTTAFLIEQLRP
ncbi:hypothetical protein [Clostridium sp. E02]|uniref:hypothetical protein n=1 Tax=Clostridium sp. E02 TaxID=2487134 RepID=UPI001FA98089|nr:hypothetical protein [Clostridium sp. E02]